MTQEAAGRLPDGYFETLYARSADPWGFRTRAYEARKRRVTLASLPAERYGRVFEPGCSIGVLTRGLAVRADLVVAMDVARAALAEAAASGPGNVEWRLGALPEDWPAGSFDLTVLSEVGYYLDRSAWEQVCSRALEVPGDVVAVHWRHQVADYLLTGDEVHEVLAGVAAGMDRHRVVTHVEDDFLLDVWSADPRSVARRSGLEG